ncbi:MAG: branched-chain amino acid ABC transporter substrate-binding protein [Burkholderiaceae bacterium]
MSTSQPLHACFILLACWISSACSPIPDTVKIGVAQPLSGPLASQGADLLHGVQMAVDEINAQGLRIKGKTVKLDIVQGDDKSNAEEGKRVAEMLVGAGVVAVVGHLNSGVSIPAAPIYAAKNIPQLAISTKPDYTQLGLPTTFRIVGNDSMQSKALGSYAAQQMDGKVFALVDDGTPFGKGLAGLAAVELKKYGKVIAVQRSLDDTSTDFTQLVAELKAAGVDTYVTTQPDFQVAALCEQLMKAGHADIQIIGADTLKTDKLPSMKCGVRAVYATSPIVEAREFRSAKEWLPKFVAAYKSEPIYGAHYTYDATHVLVAAMRRAESVDPKKLTEELKRIDALAPVTNNMRFRADGEQHYPVVSVYKVVKGRWEPVTRSDSW